MTTDTLIVSHALQVARDCHRAGDLQRSEDLCRRILTRAPGHALALNLLGIIACQRNQWDAAIRFLQGAIAVDSNVAEFHHNLGSVYQRLRALEESVRCYVDALRRQPTMVETYRSLASILTDLALPGLANFATRVSNRLRDLDRKSWSGILTDIVPRSELAQFYIELAVSLSKSDTADAAGAACACLESALVWAPKSPAILNDYSVMLSRLGRDKEALDAAIQAVHQAPQFSEAHSNLGTALTNVGHFAEAVIAHRRALELGSAGENFARLWSSLAYTLSLSGKLEEAAKAYRASLTIESNDSRVHISLACLLLKMGDFDAGWREFEWRLVDQRVYASITGESRWHGESLAGRTLLIKAEQGFGDTLQFFRYVQLLCNQNHQVTLECQQPLMALLAANTGAAVIELSSTHASHDYYIPIMSLPLILETRPDTIPTSHRYIVAPDDRRQDWSSRVAQYDGFKVGLVWASGSRPSDVAATRVHRNKSLPFPAYERLLSMPGITYFNLQKDHAAAQAREAIESGRLIDWSGELKDFADNAALIANLDLVISVDTAMAHLAAAMGKRTWILLPFSADWRWFNNREDSPWYPTARLFIQKRTGNWPEVIELVARSLSNLATTQHHGGHALH